MTLTLLSRLYCHLCDDMSRALDALRSDWRFEVEVVDVDSDPALEERYGEVVPVLLDGDTEICQTFLDPRAVVAHLRQIQSGMR